MFSLIFEAGIATSGCIADDAFRTRASMSAIGSVIVIETASLPRRLRDTGDLPGMCHLTETEPAETEPLVHGPWPAATPATRVAPNLELGFPLGLVAQCGLCHI